MILLLRLGYKKNMIDKKEMIDNAYRNKSLITIGINISFYLFMCLKKNLILKWLQKVIARDIDYTNILFSP